ncbi:MAG: hypothetical protein ACW98U_00650 [Candidatus Thorarchaeota archaeon]|jgi:hypothetical protein
MRILEVVRKRHLTDCLVVVAFIAPFNFWFSLYPYSSDFRVEIFGILWSYVLWVDSGVSRSALLLSDWFTLPIGFLMSGLRFVFVFMIHKHQRGLVRRRTVWASAVLSQIPMAVFLFSPFFMSGMGGPIPILLVLGLIIDRKIGVEPPSTPWDGESTTTTNGWLSEQDPL